MITIISGTNRPDSKTLSIATWCRENIIELGEECQLLDLTRLNIPMLTSTMYDSDGQNPYIRDLQEKYLINSDLWLIISPEYNGSFPGVLKLFIDAVSVSNYNETFSGKKAALIGVASGRAGNFRGMEHLTGILNYLNILVMPNKLPISSVSKVWTSEGHPDKNTKETLISFINQMLQFYKTDSFQKQLY